MILFTHEESTTLLDSTMDVLEGDIAPRLEGLSAALRSLAGQVGNQD